MYTLSDTRLEWAILCICQNKQTNKYFFSNSNKRLGDKTGPLFESPPRPLLKSGLQPLGRYAIHQEIISRRHKQLYLPSDPRLEWPGEGPLFEFNLNKC